jgi:hypothetical protein
MFPLEQDDRKLHMQGRPTSLPLRQLPVWQGNELTQACVELRGSAKRIIDPDGTPQWHIHSLHLALMGTKRDGELVQIILSKWFSLDDPEKPSPEALDRLEDLKSQATRLGFEQRLGSKAPWFVSEFRPRIRW